MESCAFVGLLTGTFGVVLIEIHSEIMRHLHIGKEHKARYRHIKPSNQHNMLSPIYRLTDEFSFHVDQRQAVPLKEISIL